MEDDKLTPIDRQHLDGYALFLKDHPAITAALADVLNERYRQVVKWGRQRHANPGAWLAILGEEFGEVAEAAGPLMGLATGKPTDADDLYTELIHVAAVAVAWAEQIAEERGKKTHGAGRGRQ